MHTLKPEKHQLEAEPLMSEIKRALAGLNNEESRDIRLLFFPSYNIYPVYFKQGCQTCKRKRRGFGLLVLNSVKLL